MSATLPDECLEWTRKFTGLDVGGLNGSPGTQAAVSTQAGSTAASPPPAPDAPADPRNRSCMPRKPVTPTTSARTTSIKVQVGDWLPCCPRSVEIAKLRPDVIKKMIKDNGNGTYNRYVAQTR